MALAIRTKYHPASAVRSSRISAEADGVGRVYIPYPHETTMDDRHREAALALCKKLGWTGDMVEGYLCNGQRVFVFTNGGVK